MLFEEGSFENKSSCEPLTAEEQREIADYFLRKGRGTDRIVYLQDFLDDLARATTAKFMKNFKMD